MLHLEGIVLFFLLGYVKSQMQQDLQPRPERCDRPAEFMYRQCCVFPAFFTRDVAKMCGAIFAVNSVDNEHNVTLFTRQTMSVCDHWTCMLKKYGLLTSDSYLDDEKYFAHLDKWSELNPQFTTVLTNAQVYCKNSYRVFMPLTDCEFMRLHGCIRNFVTVNCPVTIPSKKCLEQKKFYDECRDFFI